MHEVIRPQNIGEVFSRVPCSRVQLLCSHLMVCQKAAKSYKKAAKQFERLHSVSAARCSFTFTAGRLPNHCISAAKELYSYFAALFRRCTALVVSYGLVRSTSGRRSNCIVSGSLFVSLFLLNEPLVLFTYFV